MVWLPVLSPASYISSSICGKSSAWVMMAVGMCDSKTGASKVDDEIVNEVIEWEAKARSLMINSANRSVTTRGRNNLGQRTNGIIESK